MRSGVKKLVLAMLLAWCAPIAAPGTPATSVASAEPRQREILRERPSGFWTSNRPAVGGAYKWRLLGIGVAIAGVMGFVVLRVMRHARQERESRLRNGR